MKQQKPATATHKPNGKCHALAGCGARFSGIEGMLSLLVQAHDELSTKIGDTESGLRGVQSCLEKSVAVLQLVAQALGRDTA
jgi:hypothetical protein